MRSFVFHKIRLPFSTWVIIVIFFLLSIIGTSYIFSNHNSPRPTTNSVLADQTQGCQLQPTTDTMLIIDTSNSMQNLIGGDQKLAKAKQAAVTFVTLMYRSGIRHKIGVAHFADRDHSELTLPPIDVQTGYNRIITAITSLRFERNQVSRTCVSCGIEKAINPPDGMGASRFTGDGNRKAVVLLTDGKANQGSQEEITIEGGPGHKKRKHVKAGVDSGLQFANDTYTEFAEKGYGSIPFYTIGVDNWPKENFLKAMSDMTNGQYYNARTLDVLETLYSEIAGKIMNPPSDLAIRGSVFIDRNRNKKYDSGEIKLQGISVAASGYTQSQKLYRSTTDAGGNYLFDKLCVDDYTVQIADPNLAQEVYFPNSNDHSYVVDLIDDASGCAIIPSGGNASCNGQIASNVSFALKRGTVPPTPTPTPTPGDTPPSSTRPWYQAYGLDVRVEGDFSNPIPQNPNAACGSDTIKPASSSTPGIFFSGSGTASKNKWVVGNSIFPDVYKGSSSELVTSFTRMVTMLRSRGVIQKSLDTYCLDDALTCTIPDLPSGIYQSTHSIILSGLTVPKNTQYIFLIDGDLTIRGKISVPVGSNAIFISSNDIIVGSSIGSAPACSSDKTQLEGFYSADRNVIVGSKASCPSNPDLQLGVGGAIVANAAGKGGAFENSRTLCNQNASYPSFFVKERPDLILNMPEAILTQGLIWRELSP